MNILFVNQPLGNRGDEAAHRGVIREINKRFPDATVRVLSPNGNKEIIKQISVDYPKNQYIAEKVRHRGIDKLYSLFVKGIHACPKLYHLWKFFPMTRYIMKHTEWADIVFCAPGGICMGGFMNWSHVTYLAIAKFLNKPVYYFCRSIGPFYDEPKIKKLFKDTSIGLLKSFEYVALRDKNSQMLADSLGVKYQSTTDAAFLDDTQTDIPVEIAQGIGEKEYCVFVPNSLTWQFSFKDKDPKLIEAFYLAIVKHIESTYPNLNIVFLPQTFLNPWGNDVEYFRELKMKYPCDKMIIIDDVYGSDVQQAVISTSKFVIGARYHSVVFAINQNVPFCALSYEHKIEGLLQLLDATKHMIDIRPIFDNADKVQKGIEVTKSIIDDIMQSSDNRCEEFRMNAKAVCHEQFDIIEELIKNAKNKE